MIFRRPPSPLILVLALAACHPTSEVMPGDPDDHRPWNGIAAGERVYILGTEPFWGGKVDGDRMTYTTPENEAGQVAPVSRFAGRGGVSYSGTLGGKALTMVVTPAENGKPCSDGMSDAHYPYAVMLRIGEETRQGCGWTDRQPRRNVSVSP